MLKLIYLLISRNWRSLAILFSVVFFASTGFIVMRLIAGNIELTVARETRPLFGADLRISYEWLPSDSLITTFGSFLSGSEYRWGETRAFSTTLLGHDGDPGLVQVIAYTWEYPQKGILETISIDTNIAKTEKVSVSDDLWNQYTNSGIVEIDKRQIRVTDRIVKSSDLGFAFGTDNSLIILPQSLLSGSLLISSGSRLQSTLYLSFADETDATRVKASIDPEQYREYQIRTYSESSERSLDIVGELSRYILLILLVSFVFASVVMRSAHDRLFTSLGHTLSIIEILGFTRRRQRILFVVIYILILPLAFLSSVGLSYAIILAIAWLPGASGFVFLSSALPWSFSMLSILVFLSFFPAWRSRFDLGSSLFFSWIWEYFMRKIQIFRCHKAIQNREKSEVFASILSYDLMSGVVLFISLSLAVYLIFTTFMTSLLITGWAILSIIIISLLLSGLYRLIFRWASWYRSRYFSLYDALRSHVRPLSPTIPVTLSLVMITVFFIMFLLFSLSFRSKLAIDMDQTANIYAINILPADREKIEKYLSGSGEMYSVLRARIRSVNGRSLVEHLGTPNPTGEFTREFNITTTPLDNEILEWKMTIAKDEVSIDHDFADRLGVWVGDQIEFLLSGKSISLTIANIRKSERVGFRPFFYFSFDPEAFRSAPQTYFATAYVSDIITWKQWILANSWPHVTFVDIENILVIVRDISAKVFSVISLFLFTISLFSLFAIIALFGQLDTVESIKSRLYPLFGMTPSSLRSSLRLSRASIFAISWILSMIIGIWLSLYIFSLGSFLTFSWMHVWLVSLVTAGVYLVLVVLLRTRV